MANYVLNVFDPSGETLLDESIEANDDHEANEIGEKRVNEEGYEGYTSRVTSSDGRLVLFHR